MKSVIKNLLLLILLFALGTLLLGLLNPGIKVEDEVEISVSKKSAWDTFVDTSTWSHWMYHQAKLDWLDGDRLREGSTYRIIPTASPEMNVEVQTIILDSSLVTVSTLPNLEKISTVTFTFDNGKTTVKEEEFWKASSFMDNIQLNFNRSALSKSVEIRMDSLKQWIEVRSRVDQ